MEISHPLGLLEVPSRSEDVPPEPPLQRLRVGQARQLEEEQKGRRVAQTGKQDRSREVRALWAAVRSFTALCKGSLHQSS